MDDANGNKCHCSIMRFNKCGCVALQCKYGATRLISAHLGSLFPVAPRVQRRLGQQQRVVCRGVGQKIISTITRRRALLMQCLQGIPWLCCSVERGWRPAENFNRIPFAVYLLCRE